MIFIAFVILIRNRENFSLKSGILGLRRLVSQQDGSLGKLAADMRSSGCRGWLRTRRRRLLVTSI